MTAQNGKSLLGNTALKIIVFITMINIIVWRVQQSNVERLQMQIDSLENNIESIFKESMLSSGSDLIEKIKLKKDILLVRKDVTAISNGILTTIAQILGGCFVGFTAYVGYRNFQVANDKLEEDIRNNQENQRIASDKQIDERFSKAIEHLGSNEIAIRLGGLYTLKQIAVSSPAKYDETVLDIMIAFIREKSPLDFDMRKEHEVSNPGLDIKTAFKIIATGDIKGKDTGKYTINLKGLNLARMEIDTNVNLDRANLQYTDLRLSKLNGSKLRGATMNGAILTGAKLN